jgi:hypothetical protein
MPQTPGHGSRQENSIQAKFLEHWEFEVHSGRQFGGVPIYFGRQEHAGTEFPRLRHSEYGPQGEGTQGSRGISSSLGTKIVGN